MLVIGPNGVRAPDAPLPPECPALSVPPTTLYHILHVNPVFATRLGLCPADLVGTCPRVMLDGLVEPFARDMIVSALQQGAAIRLETWVRPGRGATHLAEIDGVPLGTGLFGLIARDVSALAGEARLRDAIESLNDAFLLVDPQDRIVMFNRRLIEIYPEMAPLLRPGVRMEELTRASIAAGLFPEAIGREEAFLEERMARFHAPAGPIEYRIREDRWVRIMETRTPDGWTVSVRTDITAERVTELRLRAEALRAEESSRAKSRFLSAMSHELRTPLNLILGFSDILRTPDGGAADPRQRSFAEDIHEAGSYLLDLINDILDMSKIEAGKYELRIGGVAVYRLIEDTARLVRQQAGERALILDLDLSPDLPPRIRADGRALRQVLLNLLANALKFTHAGGRITIKARACDSRLEIAVSDTGIGIPADALPRLGQPFEQIDNALNRRHQGTGLGLALSKSLVELHDGRLTIESEPGQGTTVTMSLPIVLDR